MSLAELAVGERSVWRGEICSHILIIVCLWAARRALQARHAFHVAVVFVAVFELPYFMNCVLYAVTNRYSGLFR